MWGPNDFFPTEIGTQLPSCSCQPLQPGHRRDMCHQACPTGAAQGLLLCLNWLDRVRLKSVGLNCVGSSFDGPCNRASLHGDPKQRELGREQKPTESMLLWWVQSSKGDWITGFGVQRYTFRFGFPRSRPLWYAFRCSRFGEAIPGMSWRPALGCQVVRPLFFWVKSRT